MSGWVEVANFEKTHGDAVRAEVSKIFRDVGMEVPGPIKEGRPIGELLDCVNDAFVVQLELPESRIKDAFAMRCG